MSKKFAVNVDPTEVGFDPQRLKEIDHHFQGYVESGKLPGYSVVVSRAGKVAHFSTYGKQDVDSGEPITSETMYRIYSMTKPITSVALMMLVERGLLQLTDPVSDYIPSFANTRVWSTGTVLKPVTTGLTEPMRIWHLLTHTAGLTYGFLYNDVVDDIYRRAGFELGVGQGENLEVVCDKFAALPLLFQPGSEWNYSVATDVLGRVVEVASGMALDQFFDKYILGPLNMVDTAFYAPEDKHSRMAALYGYHAPSATKVKLDKLGSGALSNPTFLSGGGGLVSTPADYYKFIAMLEAKGKSGDVRLLSSRSIDLMTQNHLPNNQDIATCGRPLGEELFYYGVGFGLGFSVVIDQAQTRAMCPNGTFGWGGAASTAFWIDPVNEISAMFFTQLMPSDTYPIRPYLRSLVYAALTD